MKECVFHFKKFDCSHGRSSMKIGVDAVLLGAWADVSGVYRILDVGTGCGVIALMVAQRNKDAEIIAIDIDGPSVEEAKTNFAKSPWSSRLRAAVEDYSTLHISPVDLIISNPPYFKSGIECPDSARLVARHDASLSPLSLLECGRSLLTERGRVAMVIPADREDEVVSAAVSYGYVLKRCCRVRGHAEAPVKRLLLEFSKSDNGSDNIGGCESLVLEVEPNHPTEEHRLLCKDFYLKF